jgi:CRP-like cAMP-binding protein
MIGSDPDRDFTNMHGLAHAIVRTDNKDRDGRNDEPIVARLKRHIDLSAADLHCLRALVECELGVPKRRDLVVDGYEYRKLSFIKDGFAVRYKVLRNGKRQIVNVLVPGDVVGVPSSFLERSTFSVTAITDMKLQVCAMEQFVALCHKRPKFGLALSWLAVEEAASYAERVVDTGRRTSIERLARFLLDVHARLAIVGRATETGFDLPFSQELMSDALGLSVPHLNRMMAKLRGDGLIAIDGHRVEFLDWEALSLLSHYQPFRLTRIRDERD